MGWDNATSSYTSDDLDGGYDGVCEYLPQCGLSTAATCGGEDRWVGKQTSTLLEPSYFVLVSRYYCIWMGVFWRRNTKKRKRALSVIDRGTAVSAHLYYLAPRQHSWVPRHVYAQRDVCS